MKEPRQRPGRRCGVCFHNERSTIERRALDIGESIQSVSFDAGLSAPAVYRHIRQCLKLDLRAELAQRGTSMGVRDFAARYLALLEDTDAVREFARRADDPRLLLQAGAQERETLGVLLQRLGIDHADVVDDLDEAHALATACVRVLSRYPDVLGEITSDLRLRGQPDLAVALQTVAERGHLSVLPAPKEHTS